MPTWMLIWRRSLCAVSGAIAGVIVGFIFGLFQIQTPVPALALPDVVRVSLMLGIAAWIATLVIVGIWARYGIAAIFLPSLVNALVTSLLTVYIANSVRMPILALWIGMLVGTLVGALLCRLCGNRLRAAGGPQYGMR